MDVSAQLDGVTPTEAKDRVIVALDVRTHDEAVKLVDALDNVSFFKVGLRLFLAGDLFGLLRRLQEARGDQGAIFVDLKIAGDISNTIADFVNHAKALGIRFITFAEAAEAAITNHTLAAGNAARGRAKHPKFLMVPLLSSLGAADLGDPSRDVDEYIVRRGRTMLDAGFDGDVVSGTAIKAEPTSVPGVTLVSPGIRPAWAAPEPTTSSSGAPC